jgi:hypothetical protein
LPAPNASPTSSTARSCERSPAIETTMFAGRYIADQNDRISSPGRPRTVPSSPAISQPSGVSPKNSSSKTVNTN